MSTHKSDENLLNQFVDCFGSCDDLLAPDDAPQEMLVKQSAEDWDSWTELSRWHPLRMESETSALEPLYQKLPGPLPQLYEQLVLHWRWLEVDLGCLVLHANPSGPGLTKLEATLWRDPVLTATLIPAGYVPFGRSAIDYDPLCFDLNRMNADQDCPIVQFEHEAILCHSKIGRQAERWPSFRALLNDVVASTDA